MILVKSFLMRRYIRKEAGGNGYTGKLVANPKKALDFTESN